MNVFRGSFSQNKNSKRRPQVGRKRFDIPPIFQRIRPRIAPGTSSEIVHSFGKQSEENINDDNSFSSRNNRERQTMTEPLKEQYCSSAISNLLESATHNTNNSIETPFSGQHEKQHSFRRHNRNEFSTSDDSYRINQTYNEDLELSGKRKRIDCESNPRNERNQHLSSLKKHSLLRSALSKQENDRGKQMFIFGNTDRKTSDSTSDNPIERSIFAPDMTGYYLTSIFGRNKSASISAVNEQEACSSSYESAGCQRNEIVSDENLSASRSVQVERNNDIRDSYSGLSNADNIFRTPIEFRKKTPLMRTLNKSHDSDDRSVTVQTIKESDRIKSTNVTPLHRNRNEKTTNNLSDLNSVSAMPLNSDPERRNSNNINSGEPLDLITRILQTPDKNQHLILPFISSSAERGINLNTPVSSAKKVQALLPLSSFSGSGKNNRSNSSSGPQPHTTPSDRLRTPRSTSNSHDSIHHTILAITEGRGLARGEVGIAVMDVKRPQLILCQISDGQTYTNTLTKINYFSPVEILLPNTFVDSSQTVPLFSLLNDYFPNASLTTVQRRHFNDKFGLSQVLSLCLPEYSSVELIIKHKFYALSAAAALIKFIEFSQTILFSKRSLKVEYQGAEDMMSIDMESAKQLELVLCNSGGGYEKSLFGILNHCSTVSGRRHLRANILQPPCNQEVTTVRLNCVTELVGDPNLLAALKKELVQFEDVEQLLWLCLQLPNLNVIDRPNETQMNFILLLKTTLTSLPGLIECLKDGQASYFHDALSVLKDSRYNTMIEIILKNINENARMVKGFMASQHQRCFAIKPEVNGLLDVARNTYSGLIEETHNKVIELSREYNLPLKLGSSNSKGMHIQLSLVQNRYFNIKDLPPIFIQVNRVSKNLITCTTEDILILNQRMKHALREIQLMSNVIVGEILHKIREHIGCLNKFCEIVAELDILLSFALVSSSTDFVKPVFGTELCLEAARHPILDVINSARPVGNDVVASKDSNFHIITGPNMGGKSIYIRQVALLQIMAQIGCYVPAKSAQFCFIQNLFTRIGSDDNIEHNASTFRLEMWQMKYILQSAVGERTSLIIIDELCRGTCCEEGTAIAWALCKELASLNAFTFFTTHFHILTQLESICPNIKNWHFEAVETENDRLKYTHRLLPGVTKVSNYGIQLAKLSSLPESVLKLIMESKHQLLALNQTVVHNFVESDLEADKSDVIKTLANKFVDSLLNDVASDDMLFEIKQFISCELGYNLQDIIDNNSEEHLPNNDSDKNSAQMLCNVDVLLEEMDGTIIYSNEHNTDGNFTTQECANMLLDNPIETFNELETADENDGEHKYDTFDNVENESVFSEKVDASLEIAIDDDHHSLNCSYENALLSQQSVGKSQQTNEQN